MPTSPKIAGRGVDEVHPGATAGTPRRRASGMFLYGRKPTKLTVAVLGFMAGVLTGAAAVGGYWYWQHSTTEVWVVTHSMQSGNGIIVPEGTELVLERWMPEGFAALNLGINVEGAALGHFRHRTEQKGFLRVPYFIDDSDK